MALFNIYINSGQTQFTHYDSLDNIVALEITNSDQDYYQTGVLSTYNTNTSHNIGDTIMVFINSNGINSLQFDGYIARKSLTLSGKRKFDYQLVGRTYDLWRYVTDENATYNDCTTAYIVSSMIRDYCDDTVNNSYLNPEDGISISNELDFRNTIVGDAIITLTEMDGYKFYVDSDAGIRYYLPEDREYDFTIEEEDILNMSPIEEADEDLVNDCLVLGGSGYSSKTSEKLRPSSAIIPSGMKIAQSFVAENETLNAIRLYLDRTTGDYSPDSIDFEIWENTSNDFIDDRPIDNLTNFNTETLAGVWCGPSNYLQYSYLGYDYFLSNGYSTFLELSGNINKLCTYIVGAGKVADSTHNYFGFTFKCLASGVIAYLTQCSEFCPNTPGIMNIYLYSVNTSTGFPTGDPLQSGSVYLGGSGIIRPMSFAFQNMKPYSLYKDIVYAIVAHCDVGLVYSNYWNGTSDSDTHYVYSTDGTTWSTITSYGGYNIRPRTADIYGIYYNVTGSIESSRSNLDIRYMKVDLHNPYSGSNIRISGTNSGSKGWYSIQDGIWTDLGFEYNSGCAIKLIFSGNGYYSPRISGITVSISDESGGFDADLYEDDFNNYTYLSSNSRHNVCLGDDVYQNSLILSGSQGGSKWIYADNVAAGGFVGSWSNILNLLNNEDHTADFYSPLSGDDIGNLTFTFNNPIYLDKIYFLVHNNSYWGSQYITIRHIEISTSKANHTFEFSKDSISSPFYLGYGTWKQYIFNVSNNDYGTSTADRYGDSTGYVYSGVKKIRISANLYWGDNLSFGFFKFRSREPYPLNISGNIKSNTENLSSFNMNLIRVEPTVTQHEDNIFYSGSLDEGSNWTRLIPNANTTCTAGQKAIISYTLCPYGSWPVDKISSASMLPATPVLDSLIATAAIVEGGGIPKSGSKVEWSDDVSFSDGDLPYPPSFSSWKTYSAPKLSLEEGKTYWMIFTHKSGGNTQDGSYWSYYYNPNSSVDGRIAYSWARDGIGCKWSTNSSDPIDVPDGCMTFELGWSEGNISARATNDDSISLYGKHFKLINDSYILSEEEAQIRADAEVYNSTSIPKKGSIVIRGITDIQTYYRFSSNLTNLDISDIWDVVSYTQRIDNQGFTTTINYGKQPFDIMKQISNLESEVY